VLARSYGKRLGSKSMGATILPAKKAPSTRKAHKNMGSIFEETFYPVIRIETFQLLLACDLLQYVYFPRRRENGLPQPNSILGLHGTSRKIYRFSTSQQGSTATLRPQASSTNLVTTLYHDMQLWGSNSLRLTQSFTTLQIRHRHNSLRR